MLLESSPSLNLKHSEQICKTLRRGKIGVANTLSLMSFAGMTLDKCIILGLGHKLDVLCTGKVTPKQVKEP